MILNWNYIYHILLQNVVKIEFNEKRSLEDVYQTICDLFNMIKRQGFEINYVAGIVTSDGPEMVQEYFEILNKFVAKLSVNNLNKFFFSSHDIFNMVVKNDDGTEVKLKQYLITKCNFQHADFMNFWRQLLESGLITKIYLAPGWQRSKGASEECDIALEQNIEIEELSSELLA